MCFKEIFIFIFVKFVLPIFLVISTYFYNNIITTIIITSEKMGTVSALFIALTRVDYQRYFIEIYIYR